MKASSKINFKSLTAVLFDYFRTFIELCFLSHFRLTGFRSYSDWLKAKFYESKNLRKPRFTVLSASKVVETFCIKHIIKKLKPHIILS